MNQPLQNFKKNLPWTLLTQTVNAFFAVNAVNKSNTLTNCYLINEKTWTELQVQLLVKNELLLIGPFRYINFTNRTRTDLKKVEGALP